MADFRDARHGAPGSFSYGKAPPLRLPGAVVYVGGEDGHGSAVPPHGTISLLELYFADLDRRLEIGVVGDVGDDLRGVRSPGFDERGDGFKIHVAQGDGEG